MITNTMLQINFGNVSASDEGIYGCLINNQRNPVGCLRVYGESCYIEAYECCIIPYYNYYGVPSDMIFDTA